MEPRKKSKLTGEVFQWRQVMKDKICKPACEKCCLAQCTKSCGNPNGEKTTYLSLSALMYSHFQLI
jgi:hypothetical protein